MFLVGGPADHLNWTASQPRGHEDTSTNRARGVAAYSSLCLLSSTVTEGTSMTLTTPSLRRYCVIYSRHEDDGHRPTKGEGQPLPCALPLQVFTPQMA